MYETRMHPPLRLHLLAAFDHLHAQWRHDGITRPYWRLYWNRSPGWAVEWRGRSLELVPGRVLLVAPETIYRVRSAGPAQHFFLHFTTDGLPVAPRPEIWSFPRDRMLAGLIAAVQAAPATPARTLAASALALHALARLPADQLDPPPTGRPPIVEALAALAAAPDARWTTPELAAIAGMHPNAFIRSFRQETGLTPQAWQARRRVERACLALERSEERIETIAERFGFSDRNHFTRVFTRLRGVAPATYRRSALHAYRGDGTDHP
jgi:AraC-like DNA-binding protein